MKIYTKTGDTGETGTFGGVRMSKSDPLFEVTGTIDELNSYIGYIGAIEGGSQNESTLTHIQSDLFSIGAALSSAPVDISGLSDRITEMEQAIDRMDALLPQLTNFILPGPTRDIAIIHIARSVCRRAERLVVALKKNSTSLPIDPLLLQYLNRLSDYLFVLARSTGARTHQTEAIWKGSFKK